MIDDPNELIGKRVDFAIEIDNADLPANFCQDTFCRYMLLSENHELETFNTISVKGVTQIPEFNYSYHHCYKSVDDKILNYILNHSVIKLN